MQINRSRVLQQPYKVPLSGRPLVFFVGVRGHSSAVSGLTSEIAEF